MTRQAASYRDRRGLRADDTQGLDTILSAIDGGERHRVAQHAGTDRVALGMVRVQKALRDVP